MYQPPGVSWSYHPPSANGYAFFADNSWAEVGHHKDPFGDEHYGMWMVYAKGSAIWYNIGRSLNCPDHDCAMSHYQLKIAGSSNEPMCRAACQDGYNSLQFNRLWDITNYPCQNQAGSYMNIEIVATCLTGTYSCGEKGGGG